MKRLKYLVVVVLAALVLLPVLSACAPEPTPTPTPTPGPTATPAKPGLPDVPITYEGDTDATIIRRAEWIEGAKKEGKAVWWATRPPAEAAEIIAEFNKIYPFIKIEHWRAGAVEISTKLEAEFLFGRFSVDLPMGGSPSEYPRWREMGLFAKFTDIIPGIEKIPEMMYSKYDDSFTPGNTVCAPEYNTNVISAAEAPKSWEDLLDPKWKGQIAITSLMHSWPTLAVSEGGWGVAKTEDFLTKLKEQDLIFGRGYTSSEALMIAGDFNILVDSQLKNVLKSTAKGMPVGWVKVNPIVINEGPSLVLLKKAPHPNAARLFIEWMCSPQGLLIYEEVSYYGAVYPGSPTKLAKLVEGLDLCVQTEDDVLKAIELGFYDRMAEILGITQ